MTSPPLHEACRPLEFLLGTWRGEGVGGYPTLEDFRYGEEVVVAHVGKPYLSYTQRTWALDDGRPLHAEAGYWRPQPGAAVELVLAHPTGILELYVGEISGTRIELSTDAVVRSATAKEVTALKRMYGLVEGRLMYAIDMAAVGQPLQPHLSGVLDLVEPHPA